MVFTVLLAIVAVVVACAALILVRQGKTEVESAVAGLHDAMRQADIRVGVARSTQVDRLRLVVHNHGPGPARDVRVVFVAQGGSCARVEIPAGYLDKGQHRYSEFTPDLGLVTWEGVSEWSDNETNRTRSFSLEIGGLLPGELGR